MISSRFALCAVLLATTALAGERAIDKGAMDPDTDYDSYANVEAFRATHLDLDLTVDMEHKELGGTASLEFKRLDPRATLLVLDTKDLIVKDVEQKATDVLGATAKSQTIWVSRPFHQDKPDAVLGSALVIELRPSTASSEAIRITYEVTDKSAAVQWLAPEQTAGRHKAFMYTESEPIGARSWIPLQDTPGVRITYKAHVRVVGNYRAVMSAENDPTAKRGGFFNFVMPQAIPSYLIALAVGDIEFRATGPRTGVYAEKSVLKAAAREFADTEAMIAATEKMFGAYRWQRYDVLVMPPSFPEGGMENPRLSFITPTIIDGQKGLVAVIAHELAHSWAGNLVTNATWRDLWLNEGVTDYMENRIMEAVYGEQRAAMEAVLGLETLRAGLKRLKAADQQLTIDLRGRDPAVAFSDVPYEKGRLFLKYLEARFGREKFDAYLRGYFDHFAFTSITTEQALRYLKENLLDRNPGVVSAAEIDAWVKAPGLPADAVLPVTTLFEAVDAARNDWLAGKRPAKGVGVGWVTAQWLHFLNLMPATLSHAQLAQLDAALGFSRTANAEIAQAWFLLVIANDYQPAFARLEEYLRGIGRNKLVTPLYEQLMNTASGATFAKRVYAKARPGYHAETVALLDPIIRPDVDAQP